MYGIGGISPINAPQSRRGQQIVQKAFDLDKDGSYDGLCGRDVYEASGCDPNENGDSAGDIVNNLQEKGKLEPNVQNAQAGDAIYWPASQGDPEGHAVVADGRTAADGSPEVVTTTGGDSGMNGSQILSVDQISDMIGRMQGNNGNPVQPAGKYTPQSVNS